MHSTPWLRGGGFPSEYQHPFWYGKTRMVWLPDGDKISKICLFVLTWSTNVTDGRTDTETDGHTDTAWRHRPGLCISRGKNWLLNVYVHGSSDLLLITWPCWLPTRLYCRSVKNMTWVRQEFSIVFNAEKSTCLDVSRPLKIGSICEVLQFAIDGKKITIAIEWQIISSHMDDKSEILAKRNSVCSNADKLTMFTRATIRNLRCYCSDFHGSMTRNTSQCDWERMCWLYLGLTRLHSQLNDASLWFVTYEGCRNASFLCLREARLVDGGIMFSVWPFRSFVRLFVWNLWPRYFENERTAFDANWHRWSTGQGHETINFGIRGSKFKVTWGRR